jgi:chain length determinant protein EpsF
MNLTQFLLILRARALVALVILTTTVGVAVGVSLLLPKQYLASTAVVIDVKSPDPIAGVVLPALVMPGYMATQVDIINSDRVAQRTISLLSLDKNPAVLEGWRAATQGRGTVTAWLIDLLQKGLDVKPSRDSNVININFRAVDPEFAALVANGFAQAYIDTTIELRVEPARQYASWFDQQAKELRERLEAAQDRYSEYQRQAGMVVSDDRLDYENQKLNELQAQLVIVETQSADASSKQKSGESDNLQEVMQNPLVQQLKVDIARLESRLKELGGNLGTNHPQYQRQQAELASLRERLVQETQQITAALDTSSRISRGKQQELRSAIESHKRHILRLRQGRTEAGVLQREVEAAQRAYDAVSQRYAQASLESQVTQTNVAVLTPAVAPVDHTSPKLLLNTLMSLVLGTLLGIGGAIAMEMLDRRVRSRDDIERALELPVLADFSPARRGQPA